MADVTAVNGQITDAVTQTTVNTLGTAPASAAGNLANAAAQAFGLMMENAVTAQQALNLIGQAVTARSVAIVGGGNL
jgi:hypothetical protein